MTEEERKAEEPGGRQKKPIAFVWLFLAVIPLSFFFGVVGKLMARGLGMADSSNIGAAGIIVAGLMILLTAPKSIKQLGLIMAMVAAGGTLAILPALAFKLLDWGFWGDMLGSCIAGGLGAAIIGLLFKCLGVEYRQPPSRNSAASKPSS